MDTGMIQQLPVFGGTFSMIAPKSNGKARRRRQEQQLCHLSYAPTALAGTQSRQWEKEAANKPGWIARSKKNAGFQGKQPKELVGKKSKQE